MSQHKNKTRFENKTQPLQRQSQGSDQSRELFQTRNVKVTQSQKLSDRELKDTANKMVFYLVAVHGCKGIIRRSDLTTAVIKKEHGRHFRKIIDIANKKLKTTFGLKLVPCDDKYSNLMLINCIERRSGVPLNIETKFKSLDSLILIVLAVIYMYNDSISEVLLLRFLETLGFSGNYIDNDIGKIMDVLRKDLVYQQYLNYVPMENAERGDEVQYKYSWGLRAHHQVNKEKMLKFISKVYDRDPSSWIEQHLKIQEEKLDETDSELSTSDSDINSEEEDVQN